MNNLLKILAAASIFVAGCSSSFQGIRFRAQSPSIEEAFRKLSLAATSDGYEMWSVQSSTFFFETKWRPLKAKEQSDGDLRLTGQQVEAKLIVRLDRRGSLYDVSLTPWLRYSKAGGSSDVVADIRHPLREKWEKVLGSVLQKESKEED